MNSQIPGLKDMSGGALTPIKKNTVYLQGSCSVGKGERLVRTAGDSV